MTIALILLAVIAINGALWALLDPDGWEQFKANVGRLFRPGDSTRADEQNDWRDRTG